MNQVQRSEVLGIGAAIVDYLVRVSDTFLESIPGPKNGMQVVDYATFEKLLKQCGEAPQILAGGSAANTLKGLAALGRRCAFSGPIGQDSPGDIFRAALADKGITLLLHEKQLPTSQVLGFVAPDGHRTFRSFLGATSAMVPEDIQLEPFIGKRLVHFEGYGLHNPGVVPKAMELAQSVGAKISLDLSSHEIVATHQDEILHLLQTYVDVVFCNEDEAKTLSTNGSADAGCDLLRSLCEVAVVSRGAQGCLVGSSLGIERFPAYPVKPLDTTGAGDFFASGFLHGYLDGKSWAECAHYGAVLGSAVVQVMGADIPEELWPKLKSRLGF